MRADFTPLVGLIAAGMAVGVFALVMAILSAPSEPIVRCHASDGTIIYCPK